MTAGEEGSIYQKYALQYKKILAKQGVTLTILSSDVSIENLKKLADKHTNIDVGFLQSALRLMHSNNLVAWLINPSYYFIAVKINI